MNTKEVIESGSKVLGQASSAIFHHRGMVLLESGDFVFEMLLNSEKLSTSAGSFVIRRLQLAVDVVTLCKSICESHQLVVNLRPAFSSQYRTRQKISTTRTAKVLLAAILHRERRCRATGNLAFYLVVRTYRSRRIWRCDGYQAWGGDGSGKTGKIPLGRPFQPGIPQGDLHKSHPVPVMSREINYASTASPNHCSQYSLQDLLSHHPHQPLTCTTQKQIRQFWQPGTSPAQ